MSALCADLITQTVFDEDNKFMELLPLLNYKSMTRVLGLQFTVNGTSGTLHNTVQLAAGCLLAINVTYPIFHSFINS